MRSATTFPTRQFRISRDPQGGLPGRACVESLEARRLLSLSALVGTPFASDGTGISAIDGREETAFQSASPAGGFVGIDLGPGADWSVDGIVFGAPRSSEQQILGGRFQGSNNRDSGYVDLYTVDPQSDPYQYSRYAVTITDPTSYRFLRYIGAAGSYSGIGEMTFFTEDPVLPAGWASTAIGDAGTAQGAGAGYRPASDLWTLRGDGFRMFDFAGADGLEFVHHSARGNGQLSALALSIQDVSTESNAGIMYRNGTGANAAFAALTVTSSSALVFAWRNQDGGALATVTLANAPASPWLKLQRSGDTFSAYYSADDVTWTQVGAAQVVTMASTAEAGLAVSRGGDPPSLATATFTDVSLTAADARPGPASTGPTNPAALRPSGSLNLGTPGEVLADLDIAGTVNVFAPNVTLRNFRIDAQGGTYAVRIYPGGSVTLEDGELTSASGAGIYGSDWTARRLNVHHMGADGLKGGQNILVEGCWVHHLGMAPGAHADGLQLDGGDSITVRGSNFDLPWYLHENGQDFYANSCFFINGWAGPITNVTIDHNWLNGGNYTLYSLSQSGTAVTNNVFGFDGQYGAITGSLQTWSGNTWIDGSEVVFLPPPSSLTATPAGSAAIDLAWADNSPTEAGFEIDYAADPAFVVGAVTTTRASNPTATATTQITGLFPGTRYFFRVRAVNATGKSGFSPAAVAVTAPAGQTPLFVTSASSVKTHSVADFALPLTMTGSTIEPRTGGPTKLVFTFSEPPQPADGLLDATEFVLTNATFASASLAGNTLTLSLIGIPNQQYVSVALQTLQDAGGSPLSGDTDVSIGALHGDIDQSRSVNLLDFQRVKLNLLAPLTPTNFLADLDCSGQINLLDFQTLKVNLLKTL